MKSIPRYVLVTPARNEEHYIRGTLEAVVRQHALPLRWVMVDDGSTDRTGEIISSYAARHAFIEMLHLPEREKRNFSSQVFATRAGVTRVEDYDFDYLGVLDADVSFEPDYYQRLLQYCQSDRRIGIAGGVFYHLVAGEFRRLTFRDDHVGGGVHFFRRLCYEQVGGYLPLRHGGQDVIAEVMARMYGWSVRTFPELAIRHHKPFGSTTRNFWHEFLRLGYLEYGVGSHFLFVFLKSIRRWRERPVLLGTLLRLSGYLVAGLRRQPRAVPREVVRFLRAEQMHRIRSLLKNRGSSAV